jgi:hypothetical protein
MRSGGVAGKELSEGGWCVESRYLPGPAVLLSKVLKPEDLAIRGIGEGNPKAVEVERTTLEAPGIPLSLDEDFLRTEAEFLGLNNGEGFPPVKEDVISRTGCGFVLSDGRRIVRGTGRVLNDGRPACRFQGRVNEPSPSLPFVHLEEDLYQD